MFVSALKGLGVIVAVGALVAVADFAFTVQDQDPAQPPDVKEPGPRPFTAIVFRGVGTVSVRQADKDQVSVRGGASPQSRVQKGVLYLGGHGNFDVEVRRLKKIEIAGAGNVQAKDLDLDRLDIILSGAGNLTLAGTAREQVITLSGCGDCDAAALLGRKATVNLTGTGTAVVHVTESLKANIPGAGAVEFVGKPARLEQSVTGIGRVRPRAGGEK
jgi:hypothetical protein